jgi:2-oxoisovalerate dehydrogenase E1 component
MLEHKGLYWSKVKGTEDAKTIEPDEDYVIPFGKGRIAYQASDESIEANESLLVITYGMGVYWSKAAGKALDNKVEVLDLRTLYPLDEELMIERAKKHNKVLIVTEEPERNGFAQGIAGWLQQEVFEYLDAPVMVIGSENMPAIPLNSTLEATMVPSAEKVADKLRDLASY